jgi:glycosyltransferase involved in cell wall biosynthesis
MPESRYSLSMVVPAFNEEQILDGFLRKSAVDLAAVSGDWEIVLVDDGSTDQTLEIARRVSREIPQVRVIPLGRNLGTGANFVPAFLNATKQIVFNNTVDAFFDTSELPHLLPFLDQADVVSGYRTDLKANNPYQKLLTLGNYVLIRFLFDMPLKAYQTLQFHRREFFHQIEMEARSSFLSPELLYKAKRLGKTIVEVPITFHPRRGGVAKGGRLIHVIRSVREILRFWFRWRVRRRIRLTPSVTEGSRA